MTFNKESVSLLTQWIRERYKAHLNKDLYKKDPPWSEWDVMRKYHFTNVKREQDRESKNFIRLVATNSDLTLEEKVAHAFIFRFWNLAKTFELMGFPRKKGQISEEEYWKYDKVAREELERLGGKGLITSAFIAAGSLMSWRRPEVDETTIVRGLRLWNHLWKNDIPKKVLEQPSGIEASKVIKTVPSFRANFLSWQVYEDITYCDESPFGEDDWIACGPGCILGLSILFPEIESSTKKDSLFYVNCLKEVKEREKEILDFDPKELFVDLPEEKRVLTLANWENIFCEFSKTWKYVHGGGKKRLYHYQSETLF